jgi:hypothetical protein
MTSLNWLLLAVVVLSVAVVGLRAHGARRWASALRDLTASLQAAQVRAPGVAPVAASAAASASASAASLAPLARYDASELDGLPAPVQRYFRAALTDGQAFVAAATLQMAGTFNLSATREQWRPFSSCQRISTCRPGFVWDARIMLLPGLAVHVVDSYIAGQGLLKASLLGLFKVADMRGGGDIARGEFMRYFAEAPWYPTALLPSQGVRWQAVDARSANATLVDGPISLTLLFRFDEAGMIESFRAESRGGMVGKVLVHAPWEGRYANYQSRDGMLVPFAGQVAWMRPQGRKDYFQGAVTQLSYEFAP